MATSILPPEVSQQLSKIERTIRSFSLVRGLGLAFAVFSVALCAGLLVDYLVDLGSTLRILMLAAVVLTTGFTIWKAVIRPAMWSMNQIELAAMVETAQPKLDERLTSTIELSDPDTPDAHRGSDLMRSKLREQTQQAVRSASFTEVVSAQPMQKALTFATLAGTLLLIPVIAAPGAYGTLLQRFFQPWANIQRVTNLHFEVPEGNRVVAKGSDVEIQAIPHWRSGDDNELPSTVLLHQTTKDGATETRRMRYRDDDESYFVTLSHVLQPFTYEITAEAAKTEQFSIDVVIAPKVKTVQLTIEPPAYTGLPATLLDGAAGQIEAFEHSQLAFELEFSKPVVSAELVWLSLDEDAVDPGGNAKDTPPVPFVLNKNGRTGEMQMPAERSGRFAFRIVDTHGLENEEKADRYLTLLKDQPPVLHVAGSDAPDEAHPKDILPIRIAASDDIGLGQLELHIEVGHNEGNEEFIRPMQDGPDGPKGKLQLTHEFKLNLSEFTLTDGTLVAWRIRAADRRPIPGPNETWSGRRFLTINSDAAAPGAQQLAFEQNELKQELDRIIAKITQDRDTTQAMKDGLKRRRTQPDEANDQDINDLAASQNKLTQDLNALNKKLATHPLFKKQTENSQEVADEILPEAEDRFSDARSTENVNERVVNLEKATRKLNEAAWKLNNVRRELEKMAEIERDLLELQRLANQTDQLADNTEKMDADRQAAKAMPEGAEKDQAQNAAANQEQQLAEEQDQLVKDLNDLLDRRPELIESAKRAQLERMQQLAEQAQQLVEPQRRLEQAFREEGQQAGRDIRELDKEKWEAVTKAQQMTREARKVGADNPKAAEEKMQKAAEAMQQGDLARANELHQQVKDELNRLANSLRKPDDPKVAIEQMAKKQNELADTLQKQAEAGKSPEQNKQALQQAAKDQQQLQKAIANSQLPDGNTNSQQQAAEQAKAAQQESQQGDAKAAADKAREAAETLEKLAKELPSKDELRKQAKQQVDELRKQQEAVREKTQQDGPTEATREEQQQISKDLAGLIAPDAAREAATAAERSGRATREMAKEEAASAIQEQQQVEQEMARMQEKLAGKPTSDDQLQELVKQQQQVQREASKSLSRKGDPTKAAEQQQEIADNLAKLDTPSAKQQQQNAVEAAQKAAEQIKSGDRRKAEAAMNDSRQAMQQLADKLGNRQPSAAQQSKSGDQQQREATAEKAEALQKEIASLQEKLEEARKERIAANDPSSQQQEEKASQKQPDGQKPTTGQQDGDQQLSPEQQALKDALAEQRAIAEESTELARSLAQTDQKSSAEKVAAKAAQTMSEQARSAALSAQSGMFNAAKDVNQAAAKSAERLDQALQKQQDQQSGQSGQQGQQRQETQQPNSDAGKRAEEARQDRADKAIDLKERMEAAAEKMSELGECQKAGAQARQDQQQALQQATQEIAEAMQDAANKLEANPLNMQQQSEKSQQASKAAKQASQAQQQAQKECRECNSSSASQQAGSAAQSLQAAAQQGRQAGGQAQKFQKSPVPNEVGTQVADAVEQLRKAGEKLGKGKKGDQQMANAEDAEGQEGQGEKGQDEGEKGEGENGEGKEGEGQQSGEGKSGDKPGKQPSSQGKPGKPGEGKPGGKGQPGQKPGRSLRKAAKSLADAAKNAQPAQAKPGQPNDALSENMTEPESLPDGADPATIGRLLPGLNGNSKGREWGRLSGKLSTEILQGAKKNPNSEYSKQIKLYFQEIARSGKIDPAKSTTPTTAK